MEKQTTTTGKKKQGIGSKLSSLIFTEEDTASSAQPTQATPMAQPIIPQSAPTAFVGAVGVDAEMRDRLQKQLKENQLPNFDYFKFKSTCDQMKSAIVDEGSRFKAAFAAAVAMNVNKTDLVSTANHYIDVLKLEEEKFSDALTAQTEDKISTPERELASLEQQIQTKNQEIQKLADEINALQQEKISTSAQISQERLKIDGIKGRFTGALNSLRQEIQDDITKINTYIQ